MDDHAETIVQQRFGRYAQAYVDSAPHAEGADLDRLLELAQPQPGWVMLDVATGGGHTALKFAPFVSHVTASDITPAMLDAAAKHLTGKGVADVTFREVAAEKMPFQDGSFDLVTCRTAPHHFDDAPRFVWEAARVLRPGGVLLVQDHLVPDDVAAARYIEASEKLRDPSHNRAFTEGEWRAMLTDAGLTVTHVERLAKELSFEAYAARQGVTPSTRACLIALMQLASPAVLAWMRPAAWGTLEARYTCHHLIIQGNKA